MNFSLGKSDVAEILIKNNADINQKNLLGNTPLHTATLNGKTYNDNFPFDLITLKEINCARISYVQSIIFEIFQ